AGAGRCEGRDRGQDRGGLFQRWFAPGRRAVGRRQGRRSRLSGSRLESNRASVHRSHAAIASDREGATSAVAYLRSTRAIRERCANILDAVRAGRSTFFGVDQSKLDDAARLVQRVTLE